MSVSTAAPSLRLHVTARAVIDSEPPYERDEVRDERIAPVIGSLALLARLGVNPLDESTRPAADDDPAAAPTPERPRLELVASRQERAVDHRIDELFDVVRTPRGQLPPPGPRAGVLVGAIMEVLTGRRPLSQLVRWMTTDVYDELEVSVAPDQQRGRAAQLRRLIITEPADGVAEITAVVLRGPRAVALALRMEGRDGRWVITALEMP